MGTSSIRSHRDTAGKIEILREEIEVFKARINDIHELFPEHDTENLDTTISTLEERIEELEKEHKEIIQKGYMSSYE